jgi:hypothetical protein
VSNLDLAVLADCGFKVDAPLTKNLFRQNLVNLNKSTSVDQMISAEDPDKEPITWYAFKIDHVAQKNGTTPNGTLNWFDINNSKGNLDTSHFRISSGYRFTNGQPQAVNGDQPAGEVIYIPASELHNVQFVTEGAPGLDELYFSAYDGHMWGPEVDLTVYSTPANGANPSATPTSPPGTVVPPTFYVIGGAQNPTTHGLSLPSFNESLANELGLHDLLPPIPMGAAESAVP